MITVRRGGKIKMSKSVLTSVYAPMTGRVIPLSEVPDPVFSDKILGDGIAIIPSDGNIYSPVTGTLVTIAESRHAFGFQTAEGTELLLHVGALLRRAQAMTSHRLTVGSTVLDYDSLTVTRGSYSLTLPKKEFYLLFNLLSSPRQIFTRRQLMDEIWGMDAQSDERTVDVHVKRLREKCEIFPDFTIQTVRGLGYKAEKCNE